MIRLSRFTIALVVVTSSTLLHATKSIELYLYASQPQAVAELSFTHQQTPIPIELHPLALSGPYHVQPNQVLQLRIAKRTQPFNLLIPAEPRNYLALITPNQINSTPRILALPNTTTERYLHIINRSGIDLIGYVNEHTITLPTHTTWTGPHKPQTELSLWSTHKRTRTLQTNCTKRCRLPNQNTLLLILPPVLSGSSDIDLRQLALPTTTN